MATYNTNFETVLLTGGTYDTGFLGNGISASTVHTVKCLSAGTMTVTPFKGPAFTWTPAINDELRLMCKTIVVNSGRYVGFKTQHVNVQYFNP